MGPTELAANQFRMTQAREKLAGVTGQSQAIEVHERVGREVRQAITRIGGTMPESLPAAEHIKQVKKRLTVKDAKPKLQLEGPIAKGLAGSEGIISFDDL